MSSHREAPEISKDPVADNTDVYAFVSPDKPDTVTLIANFIPLQLPYGGPNFNEFGDPVRYEIHVSNSGDARPDVTYRFRFTTVIRNKNTFLYNTGPIDSIGSKNWNRPQFCTVTRIDRRGRSTVLGRNLAVPPVNVGIRSTPRYDATFTAAATYRLPGGRKFFAGQRAETFHVDLGSIFDLGALRPFQAAHLIPSAAAVGVNGTQGLNVHTIAIQVPKTGDPAGFPNGRRPIDDVVTIELRAVAGATIPLVDPTFTPDAAAAAVTDGTDNTNAPFTDHFPYIGAPAGGFPSMPGTPAA
jgi:hypothetical protein